MNARGDKERPEQSSDPELDRPQDQPVAPPANRAERRAAGKKGAQFPPYARGRVLDTKGPVHTRRLWSNRRGG